MIQYWQQWLKNHPKDTILILIAGCVGLSIGLWASVIILDDAMITFRVAENLAYGRGFVYNVGERVQVTTTPLYTLILAPGVWLLGSATAAAQVLNISLSALISILAYDLGRRLSGRFTGIGGALLLPLAPLLIMAFSMESYLYVALILASLDAYAARRWRLAGLLTGLTALARGDGVLLGACLLTYDALTQRRLRWQLIIPAIMIPAMWYLFATLYYGSPFPTTLSAKTAQGEFNWLGKRFTDGFWEYWQDWTYKQGRSVFYFFPVLIGLSIWPILWRERVWLILIGYSLLYVTAFIALGVPSADWYYASLMPGVALLTARGAQIIAEILAWGIGKVIPSGKGAIWLAWVSNSPAALLLVVLLATFYPVSANIIAQNPDWKAQVYPSVARQINKNTNASVTLATIDIGHIGYWSNRRIIDIVGLAQPDVATYIAQGDFSYAIRHYQPDLVLIGYAWLPEVQSAQWFQADYTPRRYYKSKIMDAPLVLFSRRTGVKVQPDRLPTATEIQPLAIDFNRQAYLTGYHLNQSLTPGGSLDLTLFWQAKSPIAIDFTVFVQLVDAASTTIVAQADGKPQNGFYPTPYWQSGETIIDLHSMSIPADLPPGDYDILLGFYEVKTGQRLQILDEAGIFKSDHARLTGIRLP